MPPSPETRRIVTHWGIYDARYEDGRLAGLTPFSGDPDPSPIAAGMVDALDAPSRILRPALRSGFLRAVEAGNPGAAREGRGREAFVELPWDEALDIAAAEIARIRAAHGSSAVYGGSYGWASAGRFHHAQSQIHRFLNAAGGYVRSVQNYSYAAADTIVPHVIGDKRGLVSGHTSWPRIAEHSEVVLAFGGLPAKNSQVSSGGISRHVLRESLDKLSARGARVVSVSPIADDIDCAGAERITIRPGTDTALMLALSHSVISRDLHDRDFLARCVSGFEPLRAYVLGESDGEPKSPAWASRITGVEPERITALADALAGSRSMIMVAWSLQRADHGEQPCWMAIALAAILGQIGLPGGGFGIGYGSVNGVGAPASDIGFPPLPQLDNPVESYIPVARIADALLHPGEAFDFNGRRLIYPDLRMIYWAGGNPFHHHQDLNRLDRAWRRPETVIVHESWWTATARRADIVFPAATAMERNDVASAGRDRFLSPSHQMTERRGECRSDYEIFSALALRLGVEEVFTEGKDEDAWLRQMYSAARQKAARAGVELPEFDTFWAGGPLMLEPDQAVDADLLAEFRKNPETTPLATPSGRIELFSETIAGFGYEDCPGHPSWLPPREWLGAAGAARHPLHLISNQPATKLHSQYDAGSHCRAAKRNGREVIRISPADARSRGISEGDLVRVFNERGACLASASISEAVAERVVQLPTGAWFDPEPGSGARPLERHGNPNVLTDDHGASRLSQGPAAMSCLVEIERHDSPAPDMAAFRPPEFVTDQRTG